MTNRIQIDDGLWGDERGLLEAARAILPFLDSLIGPAAAELSRRIASLLAAADRGEHVVGTLWPALAEHQETANFVTDVLADAPRYRLPPELRPDGSVVRGFHIGDRAGVVADLAWPESSPSRDAEEDLLPPAGDVADGPRDPEQRFLLADLEDEPTPVKKDEWFIIAFSVGPWAGAAFARSPWPDATLQAAYQSADVLELTVQLDSEDFEINDRTAILRVPRTGRSHGKARFDVAARHDGRCKLVATVHYNGNFVHEMDLVIPVGGAEGEVEVSTRGRPVNSAVTLEPRPIGIRLTPAPPADSSAPRGVRCRSTWSCRSRPPSWTSRPKRRVRRCWTWSRPCTTAPMCSRTRSTFPMRCGTRPCGSWPTRVPRLFQQLFLHPPKDPNVWASRRVAARIRDDPGRQPHHPGRRLRTRRCPGDAVSRRRVDETQARLEQLPGNAARRGAASGPASVSRRPPDSQQSRARGQPQREPSIDDPAPGITLVAGHLKRWTDMAAARAG